MSTEYQRRTVVTRIEISAEGRDQLETLLNHWRRGCQLAVDIGWKDTTSATELQSRSYDVIRERTELGSQHAILASRQATQAIKSSLEASQTSWSKPRFTAPTVKFDRRTMTLFEDSEVSLATTAGRIRASLVLPTEDESYQDSYLFDQSWELCESTLTARDGGFFLHIGVRRPKPTTAAENGTVLGVDLGIKNIAVTSTGRFFSGEKLEHVRRENERIRSNIQQAGTRSSERTLKSISCREQRYRRDALHCVANGILTEALRFNCGVIAFEQLNGIRNRLPGARPYHAWAFKRLVSYVRYKAEEHGIQVVTVDPRNTSRRCSRVGCERTSDRNRPERDRFECAKCGYEINADYNAAKNIGLRYVRRGSKSSRWTGTSQCALKSGTLSTDAGFQPYPDSFEAEFTDKLRPTLATE